MILPEICLAKDDSPRLCIENGSSHHPVYSTHPSGKIFCNARYTTNALCESIEATEQQANEIFIRMINAASNLHCVTHMADYTGIHQVATEMGDWDCVPENLLISNDVKIPELQGETLDVIMSDGRSSKLFGAKFTVKVTRCEIPMNEEERGGKIFREPVAYLLASPKVVGVYSYINNQLRMLARPVGVFKMIFAWL